MKKGKAILIPLALVFFITIGTVACATGSSSDSEENTRQETTTREETTTEPVPTTTTTEAPTEPAYAPAEEVYYEPEPYYEPEQSYDYTPSDSSGGGGVTVPDSAWEGTNLVWVPVNGGTKYHSRSGCSNMKDPMQIPLDQAIACGYEPCKRCC
ncbi:MAG: hypothetical protein E7242_08440 [Lachnospiraceae bacterium]|nr:hypothetical protein [Lachnospiraceae bacterium]